MYKYLYIWIWSVILNAKGENRESQNYTTKYKDISKDSCSTSIQPSSCKLLLCGPAATLTANSHVDGANIANLSSPRVRFPPAILHPRFVLNNFEACHKHLGIAQSRWLFGQSSLNFVQAGEKGEKPHQSKQAKECTKGVEPIA